MKQIKKITTIIILLIVSCSESPKKYYEGYIYDDKLPLDNVLIIEEGINKNNKAISDSKGYFKLKRSSESFIRDLIFIKERYKTDTIKLVRGKNSPPIYFLFLRSESDTLRMEKIER
ncbi:hypothetical protein AB9T88_01490 [Flavobacterium sp. LBUM151]